MWNRRPWSSLLGDYIQRTDTTFESKLADASVVSVISVRIGTFSGACREYLKSWIGSPDPQALTELRVRQCEY